MSTMTITAADVNKLRKMTGAGMMDCKKALMEADGDFEKAIDELRKKGQKIAAKRSDRDANEGVVLAKTNNDKFGALMVLNCETDFVAKNEEFVGFVQHIMDTALENKAASTDAVNNLKYDDKTAVSEKIIEQIGKIGEKLELSAYETIEAETVVAYIHPGNKLAALVGLNKSGENIKEIGKQIAMQIAAMNPVAIDEESVSQEIKDREMQVGREQAIEEGKPENMVDKIAEGKVIKFLKENTLINQKFIRDNNKSIAQFLKETDSDLKVTCFKREMLG